MATIQRTLAEGKPLNQKQILMLQRTVGNQATGQILQRAEDEDKKKKKRQDMKAFGVAGQTATMPAPSPASGLTTAMNVTGQTTDFGSSALGAPAGSFGSFATETKTLKWDQTFKDWLSDNGKPADTKFDDLTKDEQSEVKKHAAKEGGLVRFGSADSRDALSITSSAVGTIGSGLSGVAGFAGMVNSLKTTFDSKEKTSDRVGAGINAVGQGTQGVSGFATAATGATSTIAKGIATTGSDTASSVADVSGGIQGAIGSLGGVVELGVGSGKLVLDVFKYAKEFNTLGWKQRDRMMEILNDMLSVGKGFISTANTVISTAKIFSEIAGTGAAFVSQVPLIGSILGIVANLIDIAIQGIKVVKSVISLVKGKMREISMRKTKENDSSDSDKNSFLDQMIEINKKRWQRAIIPLVSGTTSVVADFVSICGSILNIIGSATAAAYGAGVGIMAGGYAATGTAAVLKLGAASASPIAAFTRWSKQKIRDTADKSPDSKSGRFASTVGDMFDVNMSEEKTTKGKQARYEKNARYFLQMLADLPAFDDDSKDEYDEHYEMLKATGVNTKALFAKNGNSEEQVKMLMEAMKKRD